MRIRGIILALAATAALGMTPAGAETIKVGAILTMSGPDASLGEMAERAARLYMKTHDKDLGANKVELIIRDDGGPNPDSARRAAQELITRDQVQYLTGFLWTPNANAVAPLITEAKIPSVIMHTGTSATVRLSPYFARVAFTLWQSCYALGQWAAKNNVHKVYTAVMDFAPGHDAEAAFTKGFTEAGGQIVGSVRVPLKNIDFVPYFQRVIEAKPDAMFLMTPTGTIPFAALKAYNELGMAAAGVRLIGPGDITIDDQIAKMTDLPVGVVTMFHYSAVANRPANKSFVALWHKEFGADAVPADLAVEAWDAMDAIYTTIKAQNGKIDPDKTMALLKQWKNDNSPRGPVKINPNTRDVVQNEYLRKLEKVDGKFANVEFETIPMVEDPWPKFNPPTN
jgi:branched-chain amino acid transport system substrate-binding protein